MEWSAYDSRILKKRGINEKSTGLSGVPRDGNAVLCIIAPIAADHGVVAGPVLLASTTASTPSSRPNRDDYKLLISVKSDMDKWSSTKSYGMNRAALCPQIRILKRPSVLWQLSVRQMSWHQ